MATVGDESYDPEEERRKALLDEMRPQGPQFENSPSFGFDPRDVPDGYSGRSAGDAGGAFNGGRASQPDSSTPGARDAALAQTSTVYQNASQRINARNPNADPSLPYVQAGDTGGYLDGVGITVGEGSSITPAQAQQYMASARSAGISDAWMQDFLRRNPNDFNRITEAFNSERTGSGGGGGGGSRGGSGGGAGVGSEMGGMDGILGQLFSQLQGDRARQDQERAQMRQLIMDQIAQASRPVSATDPGINEILGAQRLAGQRSAERQRRDLAEQLAADDQVFSGAFNPRMERIEQNRAEDETQFVGEIMNRELGQRRQQLQSLMALAVSSGDSESARALQAQLALIDAQMGNTRFYDQLGFDRYRADNDLGYRLAVLDYMANRDAVMPFI